MYRLPIIECPPLSMYTHSHSVFKLVLSIPVIPCTSYVYGSGWMEKGAHPSSTIASASHRHRIGIASHRLQVRVAYHAPRGLFAETLTGCLCTHSARCSVTEATGANTQNAQRQCWVNPHKSAYAMGQFGNNNQR